MQGPGKRFRAYRTKRRARLAVSFTRVLGHRPMFTAPYGKVPATVGADGLVRPGGAHDRQLDHLDHWFGAMRAWARHWARARKDSHTLRLGRRAHKVRLARAKAERVRAQKWLATTVAGVAGLRFTRG